MMLIPVEITNITHHPKKLWCKLFGCSEKLVDTSIEKVKQNGGVLNYIVITYLCKRCNNGCQEKSIECFYCCGI